MRNRLSQEGIRSGHATCPSSAFTRT
jgi:hypothetical protein